MSLRITLKPARALSPLVDSGSSPNDQLERDFARAAVTLFAQWMSIGIFLLILMFVLASPRTGPRAPPWLAGVLAATVLATAMAAASFVLLRGRAAREFVDGLGPRLRECGLVRVALVAVLDNDLVIVVESPSIAPAAGPSIRVERMYTPNRTIRTMSVASFRRLRRRVQAVTAMYHPTRLEGTKRMVSEFARTFSNLSNDGVSVSVMRRELGTRRVPEEDVLEASVAYLFPAWHREGRAIAAQADRLASLLDEVLGLASSPEV